MAMPTPSSAIGFHTQAQWITMLEQTLASAQRQRSARAGLDSCGVPEWVAFERRAMHEAVNRARVDRGLSPVTEAHVRWAEERAVGHGDYTRKFALYCADLISSE
ncbi:hypothetical protein [Stackebrandtia nassauensis]|uniref:Uncharacterized protein n=1 Tax=Stackebrandtia nassauensis (strain DSM 44728 / CIP 108903 / NRRL B-16338 / NBRC 102104 / LLR-40K-21) TaxID=446470 RepID=D3PWL6_STANL|nr:hypothetical protein [Stackebrandtia nassauensis]ADD43238.1 hypothetical protein Snas_3576 [Stackebrandtia nassauensis DSM 44728]